MQTTSVRQTDRQTDGRWTDGSSDQHQAAAIDCLPEELHCTSDPTLLDCCCLPISYRPPHCRIVCALRCMIFCWFSMLAINAQRCSVGGSQLYGPVWCIALDQSVWLSASSNIEAVRSFVSCPRELRGLVRLSALCSPSTDVNNTGSRTVRYGCWNYVT